MIFRTTFKTLLFLSMILLGSRAYFTANGQVSGSGAASNQDYAKPAVPERITNTIGIELVMIPAGSFTMGTDKEGILEKPPHVVTIHKSFYMGKYEVTQTQWNTIMKRNRSHFKGDNLPVGNVSWADAHKFLRLLNKANDGYMYRLPTEAEWEYACRAGSQTKFFFGDDKSKLNEYAWFDDNSEYKTHPVGGKRPNAWGLYDMHGNVWEWCQDRFHKSYDGAPKDGSAWEAGSGRLRVLRGGASDLCDTCSSASARGGETLRRRAKTLGFRVVATVLGVGVRENVKVGTNRRSGK